MSESKGLVTNLFICPKCNAGISANVRPKSCLKCGFKFSGLSEEERIDFFEMKKSPSDQLYELVQHDIDKFMDKPINEFMPGISKEVAEQLRVSNKQRKAFFEMKRTKELNKFFEEVPFTEMEPWLNSMLNFYQSLLGRPDKDSILFACSLGEKIGEISKLCKELLSLGINIHERTPDKKNKDSPGKKGVK